MKTLVGVRGVDETSFELQQAVTTASTAARVEMNRKESVINVVKVYRCPKCHGSFFVWDRSIKQYVCPNDETPLLEFIPEEDVSEID